MSAQPPGRRLLFTVDVAGQVDVSEDMLSYTLKPQVFAVAGCEDDEKSTRNCPTEGGAVLTLSGIGFEDSDDKQDALTVTVDSMDCLVRNVSQTQVMCILPTGVGQTVPVQVTSFGQVSSPVYLLSFVRPTITGIIGCSACANCTSGSSSSSTGSNSTVSVTDCNREGEEIAVVGTSFGATGAKIMIAGVPCPNTRHDEKYPHRILHCRLPSDKTLSQPLIVLQDGSIMSNTALFSYTQCDGGSEERCVFNELRSTGAPLTCTPATRPSPSRRRSTAVVRNRTSAPSAFASFIRRSISARPPPCAAMRDVLCVSR